MENVKKAMTDVELHGIVGGLSWTAGSITKLQRVQARAMAPRVRLFPSLVSTTPPQRGIERVAPKTCSASGCA